MIVHASLDASDGQAKKTVYLAHPFGITTGQIIINRNNVNALLFKSVQVNRKSGNKGFAFTRPHFSNFSVVQNNAAHNLNIEMALLQSSLRSLTDRREGIDQDII